MPHEGLPLSDPNDSTFGNDNPASDVNKTPVPEVDDISSVRWQMRLLPLMSVLLVGLTIFFLAASLFQLYSLKASILSSPKSFPAEQLEAFRPVAGDLPANNFEKAKWGTLIRLEADAMDRRYHQATVITLARIWTIYLGFLTGMIVALVGAAFILGKIRESASNLDLSSGGWKATVQSSSPGIILATLGTTLMIVTILARVDVQIEDRPLYIGEHIGNTLAASTSDSPVAPSDDAQGTDKITISPQGNRDSAEEIIREANKNLERLTPTPSPKPSPQ